MCVRACVHACMCVCVSEVGVGGGGETQNRVQHLKHTSTFGGRERILHFSDLFKAQMTVFLMSASIHLP